MIGNGPVGLHPLPASRLCVSLKQKEELFGSGTLISCSDCSKLELSTRGKFTVQTEGRISFSCLAEKIKPGGDAGMPEIEDNDPAKAEDTPTG